MELIVESVQLKAKVSPPAIIQIVGEADTVTVNFSLSTVNLITYFFFPLRRFRWWALASAARFLAFSALAFSTSSCGLYFSG